MTEQLQAEPVADGVVRTVSPGRRQAFLPVPTVQCHAANLAMLPSGDLACVWFGGTQEGTHDICVYFSRLADGVDRWSTPALLSADPGRSEQNPVLFTAPGGRVWLLYTAQLAGNQDTAEVRGRVSDDDGRTWSATRTVIPADERGGVFVRQQPVFLDDGRWVLPVFRCVRVEGEKWAGDRDVSSIWVSEDAGASWSESDVPGSLGAVHMNVLRMADGTYRALYRSRWADHVYLSSSDDGVAWSAPVPTVLPNNNSSIQAVVRRSGALVLAYNHASAADARGRRESLYDEIGDNGTVVDRSDQPSAPDRRQRPPDGAPDARTAFWGAPRAPLALAVSTDAGATWSPRHVIEDGDGYCLTNDSRHGLNRELSYPSILEGPDGALHVAYTRHRSAIAYVRLSPDWPRQPA
jgi:predicted neuraminidase